MKLSIIVPVLNEELLVGGCLDGLAEQLHGGDEIVVVDGGSDDDTRQVAADRGARVIVSTKGRGNQMNAGARAARGEALLFLHVDTRLPDGFRAELEALPVVDRKAWGRFDLGFDERVFLLDLTAYLINQRSRLTRSATGDQAIFVARESFQAVGGFHEPRLFEDVDLVRRLRACAPMLVPRGLAITSARRWLEGGVVRTILLMWSLKAAYLLGVPSGKLERFYLDVR